MAPMQAGVFFDGFERVGVTWLGDERFFQSGLGTLTKPTEHAFSSPCDEVVVGGRWT